MPPALAVDGPVIVLQPRRVAARSLARRIADEQGWTLGREVGWHVRFERQFSDATRVLLATEGILTARLQQDPLLTGFRTVILDEFHERTIHADLGIALAKQAWLARPDLYLVVMSATLDTARVSSYLDGCPIVEVSGGLYPIEVRYDGAQSVPEGIATCLRDSPGQILCFLPGAPEIDRVQTSVLGGVEITRLHGSLSAAEQDAALVPVTHRRVILATNIAETSLTVPGVTAVVDTGLHKVARYDPDRAIDSLDTERVSLDAADQRAGRAGRIAPGLVIRLWHQADRLRMYREPEISRIDLSGPTLDVLSSGGDPRAFDWFEPPPGDALDAAFDLLLRLGATANGQITELGRELRRLPLSPRLAAILLAANGARQAAIACALLSERGFRPAPDPATTSSDLATAIDRERDLPAHILQTAAALQSIAGAPARTSIGEAALRRAVLAGYPDRVGRRRAPGSRRVLLASGHGAVVGPESGVREGEFLIALDVSAGKRGVGSEARIRIASLVDREWLRPTHSRLEYHLDDATGTVRAVSRDYYGAIVLAERPQPPDPDEASRLLADAYLARPRSPEDLQLLRRLRFANMDADIHDLVRRAVARCRELKRVALSSALTPDQHRTLDRHAPSTVRLPSGRDARLDYQEDGSVTAAVKLQELFGLADTPRIGPRRELLLLSLLAPNGRPVQTTRDLRSFWKRTYPDVRKGLRGKYPQHPWPENPWTAVPTGRTMKRGVK